MLVQERNRAMYADGLQAMQAYLALRNEQIEIPVSRVVSIADMTLHYIFSVPCADRNEYDALVYRNVGRDRRLTVITLIVLAAMLRRTEGPQARACRAVLMEDRNEDFYDGVSLYERFLERREDERAKGESQSIVESHFSQEDFETDIMNEILSLRHETMQLKNKISHMENQQNIQYKDCVIYAAPVYKTTNNYYPQPAAPTATESTAEEPQTEEAKPNVFCRITEQAHQEGKALIVEKELYSACVSAPKLVKALRTNEALGYVDTQNLSSRHLYDLLNEHFSLPFGAHTFTVYRSR